jgi:hypothetical protein
MIRRAGLNGTGPGNTVGTERRTRTSGGALPALSGAARQATARFVLACLLVAFALAAGGCSTLHVPATVPGFSVTGSFHAEADAITIRARPIVGKESYSELFDDDLPQFSIIAVWATLENHSQKTVAVDPKQWYLLAAGRRCPVLPVNKMVDRYYHERGIRFYTVRADERTRERLQRLSLPGGELAPGSSAEGFVFFRIDGSAPPSWDHDAVLMARGIKLGGERKLDMQLPLYAHP